MTEMLCRDCGEVNGGSRSRCMLCGGPTWSPEYVEDEKQDFYVKDDEEEYFESYEAREERLDREDRD